MNYRVYFPAPDAEGRTMLDYFGAASVIEAAQGRAYELVYDGEIAPFPGEDTTDVLEALWKRHNVGDDGDGNRPRAREIRSMSIGDIVRCDRGTYLVDRVGFTKLGPGNIGDALLGGLR